VIGNVGTPAPGGGASEKMKEQPHALAYAPGVGCTVPVAELLEVIGTPSSTGNSRPRGSFAVGTSIAGRPPHRSGRARFEHPAPTSGV
jgi:hypothetical protein